MTMRRFSQAERHASLECMAAEGVDILVVGGGITGGSVAMDAAARGYRVGLVEKGDFAGGTSSKSTKLVHGGIRYLPQFDFALVQEALEERRLLFHNAPWIVEPLGFVIPLYRWNRKPLGTPFAVPGGIGLDWIVEAGLRAYDLFAGAHGLQGYRRLSVPEALSFAPSLKRAGLEHAFLYYDGRTDDVRLTLAVLQTAVCQGALAVNYTEVEGFDIQQGRIRAAHVHDRVTGARHVIRTRYVVNAGGVFAQRIEELTGLPSRLRIEAAKGVHLLVSRDCLPVTDHAVVLPETDDGRLLFLIPWEDRVLIGTTDTAGGDIDRPGTTAEDVAYLLDHCRRYLNVALTPSDIISTYAGFRPLVRADGANATLSAALSRSHAVLDGPAGMVSIVGGKLTTWRRIGEDTMNRIARFDGMPPSDVTRAMPLVGTEDWPLIQRVLERHPIGLDTDVKRHLALFYGANLKTVLAIADERRLFARRIVPDLPYLIAEVAYACRCEMALTLDDVMSRRTRLVLQDRVQGLGVASEVAAVMAEELGWNEAETARQVREFTENVAAEYREELSTS